MIPSNSAELLGQNDYANHKGRKICKSLIDFVLTVLQSQQPLNHLAPEAPFTAREICSPALWDHLDLREQRQVGLCLSWLVDHSHVPFVKLRSRRGNTLTYRLSI